MNLPVGTTLAGRFRITGPPLGRGESGVVLPARDEQGHRDVAVKLLHPHLANDRDALEALRAEAGAAGRLKHRNIVEVLGLWSDEGRWFLVSERVDGCPISDVETPMAPEAVIALGQQVVQALTAAHSSGLVHGDVRPGNVLVGPGGARLFDFGIGSWMARSGDAELVALRPGETAPEVQAGGPPGVPADLYGMGIVLYRALTGELPWDGPSPWAVIGAQSERAPTAPSGPLGLSTLIAELLHPDPSRRPTDAVAVGAALRKLARNPRRVVRTEQRWVAPIKPTSAWMVYGTDPGTGGPAVVRAAINHSRAVGLQRRLAEEGWKVKVAKEALDWVDIVWVTALACVFAVVIPGIGAVLGAILALRWRSASTRPEIRAALPPLSVPIPARQVAAGTEYAVTAGLLLLSLGFLLWWWPVLALVPAALLGGLAWISLADRATDMGRRAEHGRIATVFAEIAATIEGHAHDLDDSLALQGELLELERDWASADVQADEILVRARSLHERARDAKRIEDVSAAETLDRLRRLQPELGPEG